MRFPSEIPSSRNSIKMRCLEMDKIFGPAIPLIRIGLNGTTLDWTLMQKWTKGLVLRNKVFATRLSFNLPIHPVWSLAHPLYSLSKNWKTRTSVSATLPHFHGR